MCYKHLKLNNKSLGRKNSKLIYHFSLKPKNSTGLLLQGKKNFSFFFLNVGFMRLLWYHSSNLSHFLPKIKGRGPHLLLKDRIWAEILSGVDEVVRVVSDALIFFSRTKLLRKASKLHAISSSKYPILDSFFYLFPFLVIQCISTKTVTYFINVKMADDIIKAGIQIIEEVNHLEKEE